MELTVNDLRLGYVRVCKTVTSLGQVVDVRGMRTQELIGATINISNPRRCMLPLGVDRKVSTTLAAVEALGTIGGVWPHDLILKASPHYTDVLVDKSVSYSTGVAYGPRLRFQLIDVLLELRRNPNTRQAVLTIWNEDDLRSTGDRPCTLTLQFLVRKDRLHLITTMRSQDVWFGLAMDVFVFTQLQLTVAGMLGIDVGGYTHHVGSLHAYERDWAKIEQLHVPRDLDTAQVPEDWPVNGIVGGSLAARQLLGQYAHGVAAEGTDWGHENPWYARRLAKLHTPVPR